MAYLPILAHLVYCIIGRSDENAHADVERAVLVWSKETVVPSKVYHVHHLLHGFFALLIERLVVIVELPEGCLVIEMLEQFHESLLFLAGDTVILKSATIIQCTIKGRLKSR